MKLSQAKHAFVTGGASGLGLAIGKALARGGVAVTLADADGETPALAEQVGDDRIHGLVLDVRDRARWEAARQEAEARFGPVDILINNAGIAPDGAHLADMDPASWDRIVAINLTGVYNGVAAFAEAMKRQDGGFIVNTASMAGLSSGFAGRAGYGATKAAVVGLSECLRAELVPHGVGVAAFCPGLVPTNLGRSTARIVHGVTDGDFAMPDAGISADDAAAIVLRAIESGEGYIVTHPKDRARVAQRTDVLRDAHRVAVPEAPLGAVLDTGRLRHAFVTGGASGIGLGLVDALLAQGLKVTIADIDDDALATATAAREGVLGLRLDVRDRAGWSVCKEAAEARFGPVDVLVNNAGITADGLSVAETDALTWDRIIAIDLTGVFNGVSAFAADMRARGRGHIVNTASLVGLVTGMEGMGGYGAAKNGVVTISEALRAELAPHGVGVTCLCPGFVPTNLHANTQKLGGAFAKADRTGGQTGLPVAAAAACVVDAIAANRAFALTHPSHWPAVERRQQGILAAWDALG